jgi:hypothetical protein
MLANKMQLRHQPQLQRRAACRPNVRCQAVAAPTISKTSQLAQLASVTVLSIDTGDLNLIRQWGPTGLITDATTNPLFVSQAALKPNEPE